MFADNNPLVKNTSHQVVLPFYIYAALSFLAAVIIFCFSTDAFDGHYFQPRLLAITHIMALGWGTMMILGASHQLVPVLIESKLYSEGLALVSFILAAIGIPLLVFAFFHFNMGWPAQWGAILINASILTYLVNVAFSMTETKKLNIHAVFILTAAVWLMATTFAGLLLVFNFTQSILPGNSTEYLSFHAHLGIIGWFLLIVMGVGSRLIPMFLISKYHHEGILWTIYFLVNLALTGFIYIQLGRLPVMFNIIPALLIFISIGFFVYYCFQAYKERIRKKVDEPMQISLLSVLMLLLPLIILAGIIILLSFSDERANLVILYGFSVFFGWITALIFGMTFKTLPFIIWNKVYHTRAGKEKTPNPKDLFSQHLFNWMGLAYLTGFLLFSFAMITLSDILLQISASLLLLAAVLYNLNVFKMLFHQPVKK